MNRDKFASSGSARQGFEMILWMFLCITAMWAWYEWSVNADLNNRAKEDFAESQRLATRILALHRSPQFAALEAESATEIAQIIEEAADGDLISPGSLIHIEPQAAMQVGKSSYSRIPTRLELRNVSLGEAIEFCMRLEDTQRGISVTDLRLWSPTLEESASKDETWSVELTLTQLVFLPKKRS